MSKKAYFIGIAGKTMGPLAKAFKDSGWEVGGSDKERVYPPISTFLEENNLPYYLGFKEENVPKDADLVVVGRYALLFKEGEVEFNRAKELGLNVRSFPEVLQEYLVRKNSIVVTGTYGKTTTSALIAWILTNAGFNPSYMTGGVPLNFQDGVKITDSDYSVIEGDETPELSETDPPKFMFFKPTHLLISATDYDHPEVFKTKKDYVNAFRKLVDLVPKDGLLVYNADKVEESVAERAICNKISFSGEKNNGTYYLEEYKHDKEGINFLIKSQKETYAGKTVLLGEHNLENICGAIVLCSELGIEKDIILEAISSFKGVKTRLEFLGDFSGRLVYWDYAQHPAKVKGSLQALREHYPDERIICVFDPAMTGLKYKESLPWYQGAFDSATKVIVGKVSFIKDIKDENRVAGSNIVEAIKKTQNNCFYEPIDEKLIEYLIDITKQGDIIVFMSSGGLRFTNLIEKTKRELRSKN